MRTKSEYSDGANTRPGGLGARQEAAGGITALMELKKGLSNKKDRKTVTIYNKEIL